MKKILAVLLAALLLLTLGCGSKNTAADDAEEDHAALDLSQPLKPPTSFEGKRVLVAFFSRAGENHEVGYVEKGNTALLAEQLAGLIHADATFEIHTVIPLPYRPQGDDRGGKRGARKTGTASARIKGR